MVLETIDFVGFMSWFEGVGGFDIILPFLLVFAVVFAILDKVGLFGKDKKNINIIVAIILGFFLVMQRDAVLILQEFLPRVSMIVLSLIMLLLVAGTFGFGIGDSWRGLSVIIAIISIIWALTASMGRDVLWSEWFTSQDVAILLILGVFILVIWFIVRTPGQPNGGGSKIWDAIKDFSRDLTPPPGGK